MKGFRNESSMAWKDFDWGWTLQVLAAFPFSPIESNGIGNDHPIKTIFAQGILQ